MAKYLGKVQYSLFFFLAGSLVVQFTLINQTTELISCHMSIHRLSNMAEHFGKGDGFRKEALKLRPKLGVQSKRHDFCLKRVSAMAPSHPFMCIDLRHQLKIISNNKNSKFKQVKQELYAWNSFFNFQIKNQFGKKIKHSIQSEQF